MIKGPDIRYFPSGRKFMSRMILPLLVTLILLDCADGKSAPADNSCTPSYREMDDVLRIHVSNPP